MGEICCIPMGMRRVYKILAGNPEGKRQLGRIMRRLEGNTKMNIKETGCYGLNWIQVAQDRPVPGSCELSNEPSGSVRGGELCEEQTECQLLRN
jgi:hypothetical protein